MYTDETTVKLPPERNEKGVTEWGQRVYEVNCMNHGQLLLVARNKTGLSMFTLRSKSRSWVINIIQLAEHINYDQKGKRVKL